MLKDSVVFPSFLNLLGETNEIFYENHLKSMILCRLWNVIAVFFFRNLDETSSV